MAIKKTSLTRKIIIGLGIPAIFVPGMILAAMLGWNWQPDLAKLAATGGFYRSKIIFPDKATVIDTLDGDTIMILANNNDQIVRLAGINAPERGSSQSAAAREYINNLLQDQEITLEYDTYQNDVFGRLLAYAWLKCTNELGCQDGKRMVNWLMVKEGYAKVVIYDHRRKLLYQDYLQTAGI